MSSAPFFVDRRTTSAPSDARYSAAASVEAGSPAVRKVMEETYGNPSSLHAAGIAAEKIVAAARSDVLAALGGGGRRVPPP